MQLMQRVDKDGNGTVDREEFATMASWRLQALGSGVAEERGAAAPAAAPPSPAYTKGQTPQA